MKQICLKFCKIKNQSIFICVFLLNVKFFVIYIYIYIYDKFIIIICDIFSFANHYTIVETIGAHKTSKVRD